MNLIDAIIQGIIQGITEFLPVSSSGHLSVYRHFAGTAGDESMLFTIVLHLGTLLAVFIVFRKTIWEVLKELFRVMADIVRFRNIIEDMNDSRRMLFMVFIATLPLAAAYFLRKPVRVISSDGDIIVEGVCFLITGLLLFTAFFTDRGTRDISGMRVSDALIIGVTQMVAVFPGISRSGSTMAAGALRRFKKETVISFSFILGIPAITAAAASELLSAPAGQITEGLTELAAGFVSSLVFGILTIKLIGWLIKKERFIYFAYYLFLAGTITVTMGLLERVIH